MSPDPPADTRPPRDAFLRDLPVLPAPEGLVGLLTGPSGRQEAARARLEALLPGHLKPQRWFGAKDQPIRRVEVRDAVCLQARPFPACFSILKVELPERDEYYALPLAVAYGAEATRLCRTHPHATLAWLEEDYGRGLLHDAASSPAFWLTLLHWWQAGRPDRSRNGLYVPHLDDAARTASVTQVHVFSGEQSNSSALFDDRFYVKLYRRLEPGVHPETELLEHLTGVGFPFVPRLHGTITLQQAEATFALGILQQAVPVETDGWTYARAMTARFLERVAGSPAPAEAPPQDDAGTTPTRLEQAAPEMLALARTLGTRTAEMHLALARSDAPALRPQPGTPDDLRAFLGRVRAEAEHTRKMLADHAGALDDVPGEDAWQRSLHRLDRLARLGATTQKIRVHGDYHLGQVVRSGGEFYLLDFEGEPTRSLEERRARDCSLRDVAGMARSLEYAALSAWQDYRREKGDAETLEAWTLLLVRRCEARFMHAYEATAGPDPFLPPPETRPALVWAYLFHKALYEVRYELSHRPDWTWLPLRGLNRLMQDAAAA